MRFIMAWLWVMGMCSLAFGSVALAVLVSIITYRVFGYPGVGVLIFLLVTAFGAFCLTPEGQRW